MIDNDAGLPMLGRTRIRKATISGRSGPLMVSVFAGSILSFASGAQAIDYDTLSKLLYPPYLALNYSMMCALNDPTFHAQTEGPRGPMPGYVQHIKEEVITSLSSAEAQSVTLKAADAAKARALAELRSLASGDQISPAIMAAWCENSAKPFVRKIIETHDRRHSDFESLVATAKK